MTIPRRTNWDVTLIAWVGSVQGRPYAWGVTDCGTLVRQALAAMYAADPLAAVPAYTTAVGARRCEVATGGVRAILEALGATPSYPVFAQTGDILVIPADTDRDPESAAVVVGSTHLLCTTPDDGVQLVPLALPLGVTVAGATLYRLPWQVTPIAPTAPSADPEPTDG